MATALPGRPGQRGARALLGAAVLVLSTAASPATAAERGEHLVCDHGKIRTGRYASVTVIGHCAVPNGAHVHVGGDLHVTPGATFDAATHSWLTVTGDVVARRGAHVALGCTEAHPCDDGTAGSPGTDSVRGDVLLYRVHDAALDGVGVGGNVVSVGGGAGDRQKPFVAFSVKDDVIAGSLVVTGLTTSWFGVVRTEVGHDVVLSHIRSAAPDGNEVVADEIGGDLVCAGLSPRPQLGDATEDPGLPYGYGPSTVGGHRLGQCRTIT